MELTLYAESFDSGVIPLTVSQTGAGGDSG